MTLAQTELLSRRPCRTKIIATLGPASESEVIIKELIQAGVDLFRLNFAHSGPAENGPVLDRIRKVSQELQIPIGVLADLAGPKMRLGELLNGEYLCPTGGSVTFIRGTKSDRAGVFTTTYEPLIDELKVGDRILLADGTVVLQVQEKSPEGVVCHVIQGGIVRSRQGVNLPGVLLSIKTLQPKDIENALWAMEAGIDFLGVSFVRTAEDITELRCLMEKAVEKRLGTDAWNKIPLEERGLYYPNIIAKIEKSETLDCLDSIVEAADGIMVARGDLGVEVDIAKIAIIQKRIIRTCRRLVKPVIVATQMLESMTEELMPTRAEATDIANAILDGADACMLSGESAVGKHPVLAVKMMNHIAEETETAMRERAIERNSWSLLTSEDAMKNVNLPITIRISIAVCDAAGSLADSIDAAAICVATKTGRTALNLSKMRNIVMTVGTSTNNLVLRRMSLYWGVIPVGGLSTEPRQMLLDLVECGKQSGYLKTNDLVVLTAGIGTVERERNVIYVHTVQ